MPQIAEFFSGESHTRSDLEPSPVVLNRAVAMRDSPDAGLAQLSLLDADFAIFSGFSARKAA